MACVLTISNHRFEMVLKAAAATATGHGSEPGRAGAALPPGTTPLNQSRYQAGAAGATAEYASAGAPEYASAGTLSATGLSSIG